MGILDKISQRVRKVFFELLPAFLFFLVMFQILSTSRSLILKQHGIIVPASTVATIGALIMAKVMFLMDKLPFLNLYPKRPLFANVIAKTIAFSIAASIFFVLEEILRFGIKTGDFNTALNRLSEDMNWLAFWLRQTWLTIFIAFYCAAVEMIRALGPGRAKEIFFGHPRKQ